jgi:hypothetical protein
LTGDPAADLNRDGRLEIVVTTFDHRIDVLSVPRSGRIGCRGRPTAAPASAAAGRVDSRQDQ